MFKACTIIPTGLYLVSKAGITFCKNLSTIKKLYQDKRDLILD